MTEELHEPGLDFRTAPARPRLLRVLGVAALVAVVLAVLGAPLGLLWKAVAPGVPMVKTAEGARLVDPQPEEFVAADGWFTLLGLGFGVVAAIVLWMVLRRYRGPAMMAGIAVGTVGAGLVAWWLGSKLALNDFDQVVAAAQVGQALSRPPDLRAGGFEWLYGFIPTLRGDVLIPAFGGVVMYTLLAGWSKYPGLRPEPELDGPEAIDGALPPHVTDGWQAGSDGGQRTGDGGAVDDEAQRLSWGSGAPQAPSAAPAPPAPDSAAPPRD
ncbi:DUF2567 domain-containing protein [Phytohabitans aurantiacus]|uniref:DUF2567 domain-containing protein n=1 Tax=Phytohabitans aurantiacus TaxID=3016789 RepID=A0ABQ5R4M0_9ACTN|nr:DUF2567 domain-containing protein [Phytohabitans aurantiacus]GLI01158.1 hypothetical protein Pa4123_64340 [Phytohabitans aurantiacus]